VQADRERLEQRALVEGDAIREAIAKVSRVGEVADERAVDRGRRQEADVGAEVVAPALAERADPARHARLQGDPLALAQPGDARADGRHDAGRLVAQDERRSDDKVSDAPVLPVVDIRAADPNRPDGDQDFAGARRRHRSPLQAQVAHAVQHRREIRRFVHRGASFLHAIASHP
jgi:hypothetical protein